MGTKTESAALRVTRHEKGFTISVVHRGRRGTQGVVTPIESALHKEALKECIMEAYTAARDRLRFPEDV